MKFRKKPVVIEAVQLHWDTWGEMGDFIGKENFTNGFIGGWLDADGRFSSPDPHPHEPFTSQRIGLRIPTLEGDMIGTEGDWIIKGVGGEYYPCKPDIFEKTYEAVNED